MTAPGTAPDTVEAMRQMLARGGYVADQALATTAFLALRMGRPLFLEGEPGTGKTETMLALLVAAQPQRLLVLVPSDALREQIARKFERLGVLQELGIVSHAALRPAAAPR